jgi:hypothetical protein
MYTRGFACKRALADFSKQPYEKSAGTSMYCSFPCIHALQGFASKPRSVHYGQNIAQILSNLTQR